MFGIIFPIREIPTGFCWTFVILSVPLFLSNQWCFFLCADGSPEQVKKWILGLFGNAVAQKFIEKEIDGWASLESKRLGEDSALEKLRITTIGKKQCFKRELGALKLVVKGRYCFLSYLLIFGTGIMCLVPFSHLEKFLQDSYHNYWEERFKRELGALKLVVKGRYFFLSYLYFINDIWLETTKSCKFN